MKKLVAGLITLLMIMSLCTILTGCSASYEGTYVLESVTKWSGATTKKYVVGETYNGEKLTEQATILKVKKDKTWYLEIQIPELNMSDISTGTWEVVNGTLILTDEVKETLKVTQEGGKLTFDNGTDGISNKFVLKKSKEDFAEKSYADLYLGKYNFESADITVDGQKNTIKAGQVLQIKINADLSIDIPFTEETFQIEIKVDNTWTLTVTMSGVSQSDNGTWKLEGKKLVLTSTTNEVDEIVRANGKLYTTDTEDMNGKEVKMDLVLKPTNN